MTKSPTVQREKFLSQLPQVSSGTTRGAILEGDRSDKLATVAESAMGDKRRSEK